MTRIHRYRRVVAGARAGGFSLLETTIAVGILGVGLIMVAAIFPVALTQHRTSVEQARAIELVSKAESLLRGRIDPTHLWIDPLVSTVPGLDSPWYLLPTVNLTVGATGATAWDDMTLAAPLTYSDAINGVTLPVTNPLNPFSLFGLDILSDRVAPYSGGGSFSPFTDSEFMDAPNRMIWYGFYRRPAAGQTTFATAICKQRRNQIFVEQNLSVAAPFANPTANPARARRLPVPWRVSVGYVGGNILSNAAAAPNGLARLAPIGTKIMIHGTVYAPASPVPTAPAGRILTVSDNIDNFTVEFVGDLTDVPLFGAGVTFDVWVFPPSVESGDFGKESPLLDWKVFQ